MNKFAILFYYLKTKWQAPFKSKEALKKHQAKQLRHFFRKLPRTNAYVKDLTDAQHDDLSIETMSRLPVTDKAFMMEHFDSINTLGISKEEAFRVAFQSEESRNFSPMIGNVTVGLSSGTSGNRGLFLVSQREREMWAGIMLGKMLPESIVKKQKIAFFLRANSNLYESVNNGSIQFTFFDLFDPIESNLEKLQQLQPDILIAPPSMLRIIADQHPPASIRKVISVAEVLEKQDRRYLEQRYNQIIHQVYQATEGFLGHTCEYGELHLNEQYVFIEKEYVDKDKGMFYPIITDFSRLGQPIVRYRLNDLLVEKRESCLCGSATTALDRIEGRSDDLFRFEGIDGRTVTVFPDFIRRAMLENGSETDEYRVMQKKDRSIICYVTNTQDGEHIKQSLHQLLEKVNANPVDIEVMAYEAPPIGNKLRRVFTE